MGSLALRALWLMATMLEAGRVCRHLGRGSAPARHLAAAQGWVRASRRASHSPAKGAIGENEQDAQQEEAYAHAERLES